MRFLPLTKEQPKEMLPVVDRPAIHWVVEEAVASGVDDILIITGREKRAVEDYFDSSDRLNNYLSEAPETDGLAELEELRRKADFHFIRQREPRGLGDAILRAEKHVGNEPFLVILGDTVNVAEIPVARQLLDAQQRLGSSVVGIERVLREKISSYGIVAGAFVEKRVMRIEQMVEKPEPKDAPSDWGISGTYVLTPAIFDRIRKTPSGKNGEIQLTDALRSQMEDSPVFGYAFDGKRYDIGTKLDWMKAHMELSLMRQDFRRPLLDSMKGWIEDAEDAH
jgi:UTP--glucose-1-phosphate uridylyltransferase